MLMNKSIDLIVSNIIDEVTAMYWDSTNYVLKSCRHLGGERGVSFEEALEDALAEADLYSETTYRVFTKREHIEDTFYIVSLAYLDDRNQLEVYSWLVRD